MSPNISWQTSQTALRFKLIHSIRKSPSPVCFRCRQFWFGVMATSGLAIPWTIVLRISRPLPFDKDLYAVVGKQHNALVINCAIPTRFCAQQPSVQNCKTSTWHFSIISERASIWIFVQWYRFCRQTPRSPKSPLVSTGSPILRLYRLPQSSRSRMCVECAVSRMSEMWPDAGARGWTYD